MAMFGVFRVAIFVVVLGLVGVYYGEGQCQGDLEGLITNCAAYVQKPGPVADPSDACCAVIKGTDVVCMCRHLTPDQQNLLSALKVNRCLTVCGKPLPPSSLKCGS